VVSVLEPAGGMVDLLDGVALRVLPGTVTAPTRLDARAVAGQPGAVRLTLTDGEELLKDVEIVFRVPEAAGHSSPRPIFYVFRTFLGADGQVQSSTLDYGHVEGAAADARVVSASAPLFGHRWRRRAAAYAELGGSVVCDLRWHAAPARGGSGAGSDRLASRGQSQAWKDLQRFALSAAGKTAAFACEGLAVANGRAYVAETSDIGRPGHAHNGYLRAFDIRDPVSMPEVALPVELGATPLDLAADGGRLVVIVKPRPATEPARLLVFDISKPRPRYVAALVLDEDAGRDAPRRLVLDGETAVVAMRRGGLLVVDVARPAVTRHIPPPAGDRGVAPFTAIAIGTFAVGGGDQRVLVATTARPDACLVVIELASGRALWQGAVTGADGSLARGTSVTLGRVAGRDLAFVGGWGGAMGPPSGLLAVVDIGPVLAGAAPSPAEIGWQPLTDDAPSDVAWHDDIVVAASPYGDSAIAVGVSDPANPRWLTSLAADARVALRDGLLISSASVRKDVQMRGVALKTTLLGAAMVVTRHDPSAIILSPADEVFSDVMLGYRLNATDTGATAAEVQVRTESGVVVAKLAGPLDSSPPAGPRAIGGQVLWPRGQRIDPDAPLVAEARAVGPALPVQPFLHPIPMIRSRIAVAIAEWHLRVQCAVPEQEQFDEPTYGLHVFLAPAGATDFGSEPTFAVDSRELTEAATNLWRWWPERSDVPIASEPWGTRRLDVTEVPPGGDRPRRHRGFEVQTELAGAVHVRVAVVAEGDGRVLASCDGHVTADGAWHPHLPLATWRVEAHVPETQLRAPGLVTPPSPRNPHSPVPADAIGRWLAIIAPMSEDAARRCAAFLEAQADAEAWLTRLTGGGRLINGRRAVADAFEAIPDRMAAGITGPSLAWLAATAEEVEDRVTLPRLLEIQSAGALHEIAVLLTRDPDDTRMPESPKGRLGAMLTEPDIAHPIPPGAAEMMAWMMKAGDDRAARGDLPDDEPGDDEYVEDDDV
jgi:hypothetical protein